MESQKTMNLLEKTSYNTGLLKKGTNEKKKYSSNKEIMMEKPITFFTINHVLLYKNEISKYCKFS